ncbi:MAG: hypothetical protein A3H95_04135 [Acidobacteria bacterium RIFCSPLOWO2_02_FULL_64_15]|nr:MAG: hypothetical protein A3H95_04135 [Acidobacteria bacterium RIFCSPLOWO2_02_FULL_64_15]
MAPVKVFIAGSRSVSRLNDALKQRLDRIVAEQHEVLVGDANGADRAVQQYLADRQYRTVTVYCTGGRCRNNVGGWSTLPVEPPAGVRAGFDFYAAKDREMAVHATHGLMLWDGESRGTLTNIKNLVRNNKPVVVYLSAAKTFLNLKTPADLDVLLAQAGSSAGHEVRRRA